MFFRPVRGLLIFRIPHGLRRGLYSFAASRLHFRSSYSAAIVSARFAAALNIPSYAWCMFKNSILRFIAAVGLIASINLAAQQLPPVRGEHSKDAELRLLAPHHDPVTFTVTDLKAMPHLTVTIHNSHSNADESYSGVRLADLLAKVGAALGSNLRGKSLAQYIVASGSDRYQTVLAIGEVDPEFHPGEVLVADTMDGKPLDVRSGPLKLVVTEDKHPARSVRNLVEIELRTVQ